jgi:hypothetical protein
MSMRHAIVFLRDARAATAIEYGLIVTGIALGTLGGSGRHRCEADGCIPTAEGRGLASTRVSTFCSADFHRRPACLNSVANRAELDATKIGRWRFHLL